MHFKTLGLTSALALAAAVPALAEPVFNRVACFATPLNMAAGEDMARETSAEIITAIEDGMTLIYTDSPLGVVGLVDITDPKAPKPLGNIDVGGEPTTAVIVGNMVFAGGEHLGKLYANPSGKLVTVDLATQGRGGGMRPRRAAGFGGAGARTGRSWRLPSRTSATKTLNDGAIPQMPAGFVVKLPVKDGAVDCAGLQKIDVTGLAAVGRR